MDKKIKQFIEKYDLLKEKALVLAVSGGVDSMVLLDLLARNFPKEKIVIAHANHGIRLEARWDENFVQGVAEDHGVKFVSEKLNLSSTSEAEAREKRYEFLRRVAAENRAKYILTAHHLNDQAETILLSLTRGVGPLSVWGMNEHQGNILRPFLHVSKEEIVKYAKKNHLAYHVDRSNFDNRYSRNRIRSKVMPNLKKINPRFLEAFDRISLNGQAMNEAIELLLQSKVRKIATVNKIDLKKFQKEPEFIQNYVVMFMLVKFSNRKEGISTTNIQKVVELATLKGQKQTELGNLIVKKVGQNLVFVTKTVTKKEKVTKSVKLELGVPVPFSGLNFKLTNEAGKATKNNILLPSHLGYNFTIRMWRNGDRIKTAAGTKKLQDLFTDAKIPKENRASWPVVVLGRQIVWVPRLAACELAVSVSNTKVTKIEVKNERK